MSGDKNLRGVYFINDDRAELLQLLGSGGVNLNETDANGNTALHLAGQETTSERAAGLIAGGADINATNHQGRTPLHVFAEKIRAWDMNENGTSEPFQLLVRSGAKVNVQDAEGLTPLHVLATADTSFKKEAVQLLLEAGANPNLRDQQGRTPAHRFLSGPWPWSEAGECVGLLVKGGADLSVADDHGQTPLHYLAALGGQKPLFFMHGLTDTLTAAKVEVEARDQEGNTPLHIAARTGTQDVFDWLVQPGASLDATNNQGLTARSLAARAKNSPAAFSTAEAETDLFQAIRENKRDAVLRLVADPQLVNATNQFGQTRCSWPSSCRVPI